MNENKFRASRLGPGWWHRHGIRMMLRKRNGRQDPLIIESGIARLDISRSPGGGFSIKWQIKHSPYSDVSGTVLFTERELKSAFDTDSEENSSDEIAQREGRVVSSNSVFIRYNDYLNIPCPGTGKDGDPNISLKTSDEIKNEVINFINGN